MTTLTEGNKAPDFSGKTQNGEEISLGKLKGKKVILYFYPKDNTPGCTAEACNLRDNYTELKEQGFEIFGISKDSEKSHRNFIGKYDLPFDLITDPEKTIMKDYGVWGEKKMYGKVTEGVHRTTFIISEDGVIDKIIRKVDTKNHAQQILNELNN